MSEYGIYTYEHPDFTELDVDKLESIKAALLGNKELSPADKELILFQQYPELYGYILGTSWSVEAEEQYGANRAFRDYGWHTDGLPDTLRVGIIRNPTATTFAACSLLVDLEAYAKVFGKSARFEPGNLRVYGGDWLQALAEGATRKHRARLLSRSVHLSDMVSIVDLDIQQAPAGHLAEGAVERTLHTSSMRQPNEPPTSLFLRYTRVNADNPLSSANRRR